jgi:hypothetical protein
MGLMHGGGGVADAADVSRCNPELRFADLFPSLMLLRTKE